MSTKSELRAVALNILLNNPQPPNQFVKLELAVAASVNPSRPHPAGFSGDEWLLFREVFSDLILDKIITVGRDSANSELPYFRIHSEARENLKRLEQVQK